MSVEIFGLSEDNAEKFHTLAVSSEKSFYDIWKPVIDKLKLKYIDDQIWIYRKDLPFVIEEFKILYDYAKGKSDLYDIEYHARIIIDNLEKNWNETAPNAEKLWMG
ncbi:MAG: hypothetical protein IJL89_10270 [Firmicutes bacterium]|nr:hypothetical protein [Bacillota bacterium]